MTVYFLNVRARKLALLNFMMWKPFYSATYIKKPPGTF